MGCIKGKLRAKLKNGNFRCRKCGGCSKFKKDLCKAEYIDYTVNAEDMNPAANDDKNVKDKKKGKSKDKKAENSKKSKKDKKGKAKKHNKQKSKK